MDPAHDQGGGAKQEKKRESSIDDDEKQAIVVQEPPVTNIEISSLDAGLNASPIIKEVDELEKAKAEMGGVIEENKRLKTCLNKILNEYHTLQIQFNNIAEQETKNTSDKINSKNKETNEESELVSLSLGRLPSNPKAKVSKPLKEEEKHEEGLALGLDCKFETSKSESTTEHLQTSSPTNSCEVLKEEAREAWPASKVNKTIKVTGEDEVLSQQNPAKKARVCVRARCDTLTMNDGCQWRKYGQKISKGNPCPRAYYRCTVATTCPVRKQVQRCSQDMSILITTYEGTHNHPLPHSATAMASTTSAAASVLLSGSSTSHSGTTTPPLSNNHGLNFYLSDNNGSKSKQFYLSHPSPSNPTITLDLTSFPPSYNSSSPLQKISSSSHYNPSMLYPSSTSLNFSSSESNAISWSNGLFQTNNNRNNILSNINMGNNSNNMYYSYMQRNNGNNNVVPITSQYLQDSTIAAATKAITADPSFQSALAAALTSVIGSTSSSSTQGGVGENLVNKMKWEELFSSSSSSLPGSTNSKSGGCASSLLNKVTGTTETGGSLMGLQQQTLPFCSTKSASASPGENRDNTN